jgi:tRNA nucleotidyltransferase (CCA-adding enzyme)
MRPGSVMRLLEDADLLRRPDRLEEFSQACEADYRGRKGRKDAPYPQAARLQRALTAALSVRVKDVDTEGLDGREIGERLRQARIDAIAGSEGPAC